MATSPGQRFVRRHNAARSSTANGTAADIAYDTAVLSEGGYSWSSPEVTVDEAGLYLCIYDLGQVELASTRAVGTLVPSVNTTDQTRFRATHRYLRNSGGADSGASIGMCILDLAVNDDVKVRNPGALTPTDAVGNYATLSGFSGGLQMIRLPANDFTHVERTSDAAEVGQSNINTTRPWTDTDGTWTKITYNSEVNDDDGLYSGSGGDLTLAANTKYLIVWGATCYSTDASRHTYVTRLSIGGTNVQTGSGYQRNTASQGPPMCGMYLHETGGSAETAYLEATHEIEGGDAGTPQVADAYMQVIELPSSAEWIHVDNGSTDSLTTALALAADWDSSPLSSTFRSDGNSNLSLDAGNDAVQNDSGDTLSVLAIGWVRWDRDSTSNGGRKNPWGVWNNGGTRLGYGIGSAFSRGQQSTDDTWQAHYCSVAAMDLADNADLTLDHQCRVGAGNDDMGVYASTASNRHYLGIQVLDLSTLDAGAADQDITQTAGVASGEAFETDNSVQVATPLALTVDNGITSGEAFETDNALAQAAQDIDGAGAIASGEALETDNALINDVQPISISAGIPSAEAFEVDNIISVPFLPITGAGGIVSAEAFESDNAIQNATPQSIIASGIASAEAFEVNNVIQNAVPQSVEPSSITSSESFETDNVVQNALPQSVEPSGIASGESFESDNALISGAQEITSAGGITSDEAFETDNLLATQTLAIQAAGAISSEESFENDSVLSPSVPQPITGAGNIPSGETFEVDSSLENVTQGISSAGAITSDESVSTDSSVQEAVPLPISNAGAIVSAESFESDHVIEDNQTDIIVDDGIISGERFENNTVIGEPPTQVPILVFHPYALFYPREYMPQ